MRSEHTLPWGLRSKRHGSGHPSPDNTPKDVTCVWVQMRPFRPKPKKALTPSVEMTEETPDGGPI